MTGIIIKALSGFYYVESENIIYECKARGNFRKNGVSPLVGDRVEIEVIDGTRGVVNTVLERKNVLVRPNVANIDKLFIVSSFQTPAPNAFIIDKVAAIAVYNNIDKIREIEAQYLSAIEVEMKAQSLIDEGEEEGAADE